MLKHCKQAVYFLAHLISIGSLGRRSARSLTADIEENRAGLIVKVLVVDPISLCEVAIVKEVEVIEELSEVALLEVAHLHLVKYSFSSSAVASVCRAKH